jgi:hypothetical protein
LAKENADLKAITSIKSSMSNVVSTSLQVFERAHDDLVDCNLDAEEQMRLMMQALEIDDLEVQFSDVGQ